MLWVTSDTHFSHARICELSHRPYPSWVEMNEALIENWNSVVQENDIVWVLGDFAMGHLDDTLLITKKLKGHKRLVSGNHDRTFPGYSHKNPERLQEFIKKYLDSGFEIIYPGDKPVPITLGNHAFVMSHFPFKGEGDRTSEERYSEYRPVDQGVPLLFGHLHSKQKHHVSKAGTPMFHVGVDSNSYCPIPETEIIQWVESV